MSNYDILVNEYLHEHYDTETHKVQIIPIFYSLDHDINLKNVEYHDALLSAYLNNQDTSSIHAKYKPFTDRSLLVSTLTYSSEKYGIVERILSQADPTQGLLIQYDKEDLLYERNILTRDIFPTKEEYDPTLNDSAIATSARSNIVAAQFALSRTKDRAIRTRRTKLFNIILNTVAKYGLPKHDAMYRYSYEEMADKPYYLVPWIAASLELLFAVRTHEEYKIAEELITISWINRSTLAKKASSPMSIIVAALDINGCFLTTDELELEWSDRYVKAIITNELEESFNDAIKDMYKIGLKYIPQLYESWFTNRTLEGFNLMATIYSFTFHVGYRKQKMADAVKDQLTVEYTDSVNYDMYNDYQSRLTRLVYDMLLPEVQNGSILLENSQLAALLSMSSASNGKSLNVQLKNRSFFTTKKNIHVMQDLYKNGSLNESLPTVDEKNPIPLGRRDVPGRRTRTIFILPYQYYMAQHSAVEILLKKAKRSPIFSEFYSGTSQLLSYGDVTRYTANNVLLGYTDVSQWDASQHNTTPLRDGIINALLKLKTMTFNKSIHDTLDRYIQSQKYLKNSYVQIENTVYQYGAMASGEKQTKLVNSIANHALISTVLNQLATYFQFEVKMIRVDGDDNYFAIAFDKDLTREFMDDVSKRIHSIYAEMNVKVKALVSNVGIEMAKRYVAGGRLFFRAGVNMLNNEKRGHAIQWDQAAVLYANYVTNLLRGYVVDRTFIMTKIIQMTSIKITGNMRLFPSEATLTTNSPFKVFDRFDGFIEYEYSPDVLSLQKMLLGLPTPKSTLADDVSQAPMFRNYIQYITSHLTKGADNASIRKISKGISRTEKAKLNSIPLVSLEKRRNQMKTLMTALQKPFILQSSKYTVNDAIRTIFSYTTFKETPISDSIIFPYELTPMLPSEYQLAVKIFGPRLITGEDHAAASQISKLIRIYNVYKPSIDELYELLYKPKHAVIEYLLALGVPTLDVQVYVESAKLITDRDQIMMAYMYSLMSQNYGALAYVDVDSRIFGDIIKVILRKDTREVSFVAHTALRLEIIRRVVIEKKLYSATFAMPDQERIKLWKLLKNVVSISSPFMAHVYSD
uniref:RNA-directed RNA polymerase n=1 Tax=Wenzhou pacific spadenose shark rotavirus TaxID=2116447 RepID=A0A2P1GN98_9REOV|nr:RNA-dependent RNA polymerase [Wenzhou pacific spadenose shark rotavirus]